MSEQSGCGQVGGRPYAAFKRLIDATTAAVLLVVLLPVLASTAAVVWVTMGPPVLFRQARPGRYGELFDLIKFRTMRIDDGAGGPETDAVRLTRTGRWLRATSLDELPTLWNVLRGQMSLVGPRPLLPAYLDLYTPEQARRHEVRPGITGLAQVNGRNALSWEDRLRLDVRYVERHSMRLDLSILIRTATTVLRRTGISADGHATMPAFGPASAPGESTR
ncbi:MAG TPA: sugar transferase [Asanoa sp.]|nr:sugar transferase [Asanoa sp.]